MFDREVVIFYRIFGKTCRSHRLRKEFVNREDGTGRLSRNVGKKLLLLAT